MTPVKLSTDKSFLSGAIATLRQTLENNPQSPQTYHDLGKAFAQQRNLEAALTCYRRAVALKERYQNRCFLDQLQPIQNWSIEPQQLHCIEGKKNRINLQGHRVSSVGNEGAVFHSSPMNLMDGVYRIKVDFGFPQKRESGNKQEQQPGFKFDVVAPDPDILYQTEVSTQKKPLQFYLEIVAGSQTEFRFFAVGKAFVIKGIEISLIYRPTLNYRGAFYYVDLGRSLQLRGLKNQANQAYCQGIDLLTSITSVQELVAYTKALPQQLECRDAYIEVYELLLKQGKEELAKTVNAIIPTATSKEPLKAKVLHKMGIELAEQGRLNEAVACFKKAEKQPSLGEIYERIWQGLHNLGSLDANHPVYQQEIQCEDVFYYWSKTSKYKIIYLDSLTASDPFLKESNISLNYLELMSLDNLKLEEIYLQSFEEHQATQLTQNAYQVTDFDWLKLRPRYHQQTLVEQGYMYAVCPFSGRVLRSNQSFYHPKDDSISLFYRFSGDEIFYLYVGGWFGSKKGIYIPKLELIINFIPSSELVKKSFFNLFKAYLVTDWKNVKAYIDNPEPKKTAVISSIVKNLGHYLWNELTGLQFLLENNFLTKIDKFIIGKHDKSIGFNDILPNVNPEKVLRLEDSESIFQAIIEHNCCAVRTTESFFTETFVQKIDEIAHSKCTPNFLETLTEARRHFPLLWINLRSHDKAWLEQVEGYANIIQKLSQDYPNLAIVFDGFSSEKANMDKIMSLVSNPVKAYNALECQLHESIIWANTIDAYITIIGSGLTLVTWLANKPGVAYGDQGHYSQMSQFWLEVRNNLIEPLLVPRKDILEDTSQNSKRKPNYNIDWRIIYDLITKVLQNLDSQQI